MLSEARGRAAEEAAGRRRRRRAEEAARGRRRAERGFRPEEASSGCGRRAERRFCAE